MRVLVTLLSLMSWVVATLCVRCRAVRSPVVGGLTDGSGRWHTNEWFWTYAVGNQAEAVRLLHKLWCGHRRSATLNTCGSVHPHLCRLLLLTLVNTQFCSVLRTFMIIFNLCPFEKYSVLSHQSNGLQLAFVIAVVNSVLYDMRVCPCLALQFTAMCRCPPPCTCINKCHHFLFSHGKHIASGPLESIHRFHISPWSYSLTLWQQSPFEPWENYCYILFWSFGNLLTLFTPVHEPSVCFWLLL